MSRDTAAWEFERRRRERRRRTRVGTLLLVASVMVGAGLGTAKGALSLKAVTVASPDDALAEEVSALVKLPEGATLLTADLSDLEEQAHRCPRAGRVVIDRQFPDRLLLIVYPRRPLLALKRGGEYLLVDAEGVCVDRTAKPPKDTLRVVGTPRAATGEEVGGRLTDEWFERSRTVAQALADADELGPWRMEAANPPELTLVSGTGARGVVGVDGDISRRARLFAELLASLESEGKRVGRMELRTKDPVWWPPKAAVAAAGGTRS